MDYIRWSNHAGICTSSDFSWDVPADCGTCFDERDPDQKDFARGPDGTGDWDNNGDDPTEGDTNETGSPAADHFAILHDGLAVNCEAEPVTLVAHDAAHNPVAGYVTRVAVGTSTARGDWIGIAAGAGTLTNNGAGSATYQFVDADNGQVTLLLHDTFVETVNINLSDGTSVEAFAEDPDLAFARSGFAFRIDGAPGVLPRQIAGKPSDTGYNAVLLELEAINTNDDTGACEALLTGPVNIGMAVECVNPSTCTGDHLALNGSTIAGNDAGAVTTYTAVALDFGDDTDTTAAFVINYADAGNITLHAALDPVFLSGETLAGSTGIDVRPFGFDLAVSGGNVTAINPGATDAAAAVFTQAGAEFTTTVRAVAWRASDDADNNGVPDGHGDANPANNTDLSDNAPTPGFGQETVAETVSLSAALVAPAGGVSPGLAGTTTIGGFVNGSASGSAMRFDEAGIIEISAELASGGYLGGEDVQGASGFVGRFVPAYFHVTVPEDGCPDAGGFTYSGQPLGEVTITAHAASGSGIVTANYDGTLGFAKDVTLGETSGAAGTLSNSGVAAGDFAAGIATIDAAPAGVAFRFADPETPAAVIRLRATDTDGVTSAGAIEEGTEVRSGRFVIRDGSAITIHDGRLALALEAWQETSPGMFEWAVHTDDLTCTAPAATDFTLDFSGTLPAGTTAISGMSFGAGQGTLTLSAPGAGNAGTVFVDGAVGSWLFDEDRDGDGMADAPRGVMSFFEVFAAEPGFIDRHEVIR